MPIASNADNIRINGTGRLYVAAVGAAGVGMEIGEMDGLSDSVSVSTEKIKSNRTAARATIKEVETEREASVKFGMRESSIENLELYLSANAASVTSQAAGTLSAVEVTMTEKEYADVGKVNCFLTKVGHGAVTGGPFDLGETITGGTSSATGVVGWVGSGFVELVDVSGTFSSGETLTGSISLATAAATSIETLADMVVCDAATATVRYTLEDDYRIDADYGYIMKMPGSDIGATCFIWCDHLAAAINTVHALSAQAIERKLTFVSDADDLGPRQRITYHKVKLIMDGDRPQIGDGESVLSMVGTVLLDSTKPTGQQFMKTEIIS